MLRLGLALLGLGPEVVVEEAELGHHVEVVLSVGYLLLHAPSFTQHVLEGF